MLAVGGGLLIGGPARPWLVTSLGIRFRIFVPVQVHYLIFTWWHHMTGRLHFPRGFQDRLPEALTCC
jgi:hypothetical protein